MRRSAIICWCSLLAAYAGDAPTRRIPPTSRAPKDLSVISSLRGDDEMRAAVLRERALVMTWIEREFLPVADGPQPIRGNPQRDEIRARGNRAALAQR